MSDFTQILDRLPSQVSNVVRQVESGDHANVSDADAREAYTHVADQLTPEEFQRAATDAWQPDRRRSSAEQAADYLRKQAAQRGIQVPNLPTGDIAANDPGALADATTQVNDAGRQHPPGHVRAGRHVLHPDRQGGPAGRSKAFAAQQISNRS